MKTVEHIATVSSIAIKSDCGSFRFVLSRTWDQSKPVGSFLCANPSKADELRNDTTVFKCGNLAINWGWGGYHVLNLYPNYSTDPGKVVRHSEADALNEQHVQAVLAASSIVVIACGNGHSKRLAELIRNLPRTKRYCLRRNKGGGYLHPSRIEPDDYPAPVPVPDAEA
ncbi:DUF1643 domain-containing protein [uncultured Piscinibacter sp.]|uniref:DUF1643 domain-containing protein n=1 Tax=uncultured Piscinibacter sp. TaxID=1131835 RepID=UPI002619265C|nr:DUF1643 domain-containing protein [uncultured Piscinibacter sp.]